MSQVALVTGATSGIGQAGAEALASEGWQVLVHARSEASGAAALKELKATAPGSSFQLVTGDLGSLAGVREVAAQVRALTPRLDVLWNNAGLVVKEPTTSPDGFELTMAVNYVAPFVLTRELLGLLPPGSRVVTTASGAARMGRIAWDDPLGVPRKFRSFPAYARSKLADVLFTMALARHVGGQGITAECFHPGFVRTRFGQDRGGSATSFSSGLMSRFSVDPATGADTGVYLATAAELPGGNGRYWYKRKLATAGRGANDRDAMRLWALTEAALVG